VSVQAPEGLILAEGTVFHLTQHRVQLIELHLIDVQLTEEIGAKGFELVGRFHSPPQNRVRIDLKDAGGGPDAHTLGSAGQHPHHQLHGRPFPMQERAMRLQKVTSARSAVELTPGAPTGMAMGPQVAKP